MKTITFMAAAFMLTAIAANASGTKSFSVANNPGYDTDEPICFTERGIEFYVFPNGEFDFNTAATTSSNVYYKNGRRHNQTFGAPGNEGVRIEHDALGRVRRIGNVFVNYDSQNRIKRIGSVYMNYYRSLLTQIGNLRIAYNRNGQIVGTTGNVKGYGNYTNATPVQHQYNDNTDSEDSHTYYRSNGTNIVTGKTAIEKERK